MSAFLYYTTHTLPSLLHIDMHWPYVPQLINNKLHFASLLAGESSEVPGRLLHTSFGNRQPSTTALSRSTPHYSTTALPVEYVRAPSGLFGRRSYFVELYRIVSVIQH